MKTLQKILKYFLISMAILLSIPILIIWDLEEDYVYYFQHSKETNKEGIPFVLVDHLDKYTTPDFEVDGNYLYNTDGYYSITYRDGDYFRSLIQTHYKNARYEVSIYDTTRAKTMYFEYDRYFQLIRIRYSSKEILEVTDERRKEANEAIKLLTQPLLERVEPPAINFQWLFDELDYWKLERKWMWHWLIE